MSFIKKDHTTKPLVDTVFRYNTIAKKRASEGYNVINATIGSLCDEDGNLVTYKSVYNDYNKMDNKFKAGYPESLKGNKKFLDDVYKFVIEDNCPELYHFEIATPGGSGAISSTMMAILDYGNSVIIPNIAWGSYLLMANEHGYKPVQYNMFNDKNKFDLKDLKNKIKKVVKEEGKALVVINDPLQNPTGYSMTLGEWKKLITFCNSLNGKVVILNDIAYLDYSFNKKSKEYMKLFNTINNNVAIVVGFSGSKTMTSYGIRYGASIVLTKNEKDGEEIINLMEKISRSNWSCVTNGGMHSFVNMYENYYDKFMNEKKKYVSLLKKRAKALVNGAKEEGIEIYPFKEGFFLTIKCDNNEYRDQIFDKLVAKDIYTVKVNLGLRIAICSLPLKQCELIMHEIKKVM